MKRRSLILSLILLLLPVIAYGFTRQWHTDFDGSTGNNPDLPDWSEYYIGSCSTEHQLNGGVIRMSGGTSDSCFGAYYREKDTYPGTFPTNQDMRVMWRFQYTNLEHMGTQAGQVTGRYGAPQYYGLSGVDSSVANFYHVETSGAWGTRDVNNPLWSSRTENEWHTATFDFICDGQQLSWWMDGGNIHQVTNGPVLPPNDDGRPSQFWFGNLLTTGGANRDWTDFELDWLTIYAVERPQMNRPTPGSGGSQAVSWNAVPNSQQPDGSTWNIDYQARACTDTVCSDVVSTSPWGSGLSHTFTNLPLNQTYHYQVRARWAGTPELITCWGNTEAAAMSGSPALSLSKSGPPLAGPGDSITYSLIVQNTGSGPATGVVVRDPVPQYIQNPSNISSGGTIQGNELVWNIGTLNVGQNQTLSWQGTVDPTIPNTVSQITNNASVSDLEGNSDDATATTTLLSSGLSISKNAPGQVSPGANIDYRITVQNTGQTTLYNLTVRDPIPADLLNPTHISNDGAVQGNELVWQISSLSAGNSQILSWRGIADPAMASSVTSINNTVSVQDSSGNSDNDTATTAIVRPGIAIAKTATSAASPGETIDYTIIVQNTGQTVLSNVVVEDPIPHYIQNPTNISHSGNASSSQITWHLGNLDIEDSRILSWQGTIDPAMPAGTGTIRNIVTVRDDDDNTATDQADTTINNPSLSLDKTATAQVAPGNTILYQITVHNDGDVALSNITITDPIPPYILNPINISAGGAIQNNDLVWMISTLDVGESQTLTWQGMVDPAIPTSETEITNVATACDQGQRCDNDEASTNLFAAAVEIEKSATAYGWPGGEVNYTIQIHNTSQVTLTNVVVTDPVPADIFYPRQISNAGHPLTSPFEGKVEIVWHLGDLGPGKQLELTWTGTVDPNLLRNAFALNNVAQVTTDEGLYREAEASTYIFQPEINFEKTATPSAGSGETIQYTLTIENPNEAPLFDLEIVDLIPDYVLNPSHISDDGIAQADEIRWQISQLDPHQQMTLSWQGTIDPHIPYRETEIRNVAAVTDMTGQRVSSEAITDLNSQAFSLIKSATYTTTAGNYIDYAVTVKNTGQSTLYNIEIVDSIPDAIINPGHISDNGTLMGNTDIGWQINQLSRGQSHTVYWQGRVDPAFSGKTIINRATATTLSGLRETATAQTRIVYGTFTLDKQATLEAGPGETVQYSLTLHNPSDALVYDLTITDPLPDEIIQPSNVSHDGLIQADAISWQISQLDPGQEIVLTWEGVVNPHLSTRIGQITNLASATASVGSATAQASTTLRPQSLRLYKNASYSIAPGGLIDYQIIIENLSQTTIFDLAVQDPIPAYVLNPIHISNGGSFVGNTEIIWQMAQIASGQQIILSWQGTVDPDIPLNQKQLINEASLTTPSGLSLSAQAKSYLGSPALTLHKTATLEAGPGELIDYILTVENSGQTPLSNVIVTDPIPEGLRSAPRLNLSEMGPANTMVWDLGSLAPGQQVVLNWEGQVDLWIDPDLEQISNIATVSANDGALTDQAQAQTNLRPQQIALRKAAPYLIWPGQPIAYTITVKNNGQSNLYDLTVRDPIAQFDLFPTEISHNGYLEGNTEIVWQLPALSAGEWVDLTWQATVPPDTPRTRQNLKNEATVTTGSGLSAKAAVVSHLQFPELSLYKVATEESWPEGIISYTLILDNESSVPIYQVVLRDPVPDYLSVQQIDPYGYLETLPQAEVIWQFDTLPAGERRIVHWSGVVAGDIPSDVHHIDNMATVQDQSGLAATAQASTVILEPELTLSKTGRETIGIGQWLTYTLTVENVGQVPVREVTLIDPIPDHVQQPSQISDQGYFQGNDLIWLIDELAGGETKTVTWSGQLDPTTPETVTSLTNEASIQALPRVNATAQTTSQVLHPEIAMVKQATPAIGPGETIYYTLIISNSGPIPVQQIEVQDPLPSHILSPNQISDNGQVTNNTIHWTIDRLQPNEQRIVTWQGTLDPTVPETIATTQNTARATAWPGGEAFASATSEVHCPEIRLGKYGPSSIAPGDQIAYTLAISNSGPMAVQQVQVSDLIPAYVLTPTHISDQGQIVGQTITWIIDTLDSGEVRLLTWQGTVDPTIPLGYSTITNTATATAWPGGVAQANLITLVKQPVLSVTKQASPLTDPGGSIDYRITLQNEGETTVRGLQVEDILPHHIAPDQINQAGYEVPGRLIWDQLGPLKPNDQLALTWTGIVDEDLPADVLTITNQVDVTAWGGLYQIAQAQTGLRQPTLRLRKASTPSIHAGGAISYTIVVRNEGPGIARDLVVRDPLPAFVTDVAGSASGYGQLDGDETIWQLEKLAVGDSQTFSWLGQVDLDLPTTVTTITNIATVTASRHRVITATTSTAIRKPQLSLQLQCPSYSQVGEIIQLQARLINDSPGTLRGLQATTPISSGLQYQPGSASQADLFLETPSKLIWDLDTLAVSGMTDLQWQMHIDSKTDLSQIETQLSLTNQDTPLLSQTCQTDLLSPSLSVTKSASGGDRLNERINYQVAVRNTGVVTAYQVTLTDTLPLGAAYIPGTASDGATVDAQTIIWQIGDLGPDKQTARYYQMESLIPANPPAETRLYDEQGQLIIHNRVEASAWHSARVMTDIITLAPRPVFSLHKTATLQARPGDSITYTLTASNNGPGTARQVILSDHLPDELTVLEETITDDGFYDATSHSVQWALGDVAEGASVTRQFQVIVPLILRPAGQPLQNNAALYSPDIAPVYAQARTRITSTFQMAARKEASITTVPGGRIDYRIEVRNISPNLIPDVRVVDPLPDFTTYLEGSGSIVPSYDEEMNALIWHLGVMAQGESRTIAFGLTVAETVPDWVSQIVNEAQIIYPTAQQRVRAVSRLPAPVIEPTAAPPTVIDQDETVSIPVEIVPTNTPIPPRPPVVSIPTASPTITPTLPPPTAAPTAWPKPTLKKSVDQSVTIAGQKSPVTWQLTFENPTPLTIRNLVIEDALLAHLVYLESRSPQGTITTTTTVDDQTTFTAHLGDLSGGSSVTLLIQTSILSDTAPGTVMVNQASYTAQNIDPGLSNKAAVTVQGLTLLPVTGGLLDPRTPGGQVTWGLITAILAILTVISQELGWLSLVKRIHKNGRNTDEAD